VNLIRETTLELCAEMKNDAIALVDAMAPPDYVLNSILGESTGLVYKNLYNSMIQSNGSFERLANFYDYSQKNSLFVQKSKL
jgi:acyl-CoA oxidase